VTAARAPTRTAALPSTLQSSYGPHPCARCSRKNQQGSHRPPQTLPPLLPPGEVTLSSRKVVAVRASVGLQPVLLRAVYSQAQGCVCTALQLGGDVEQPRLMTSSIKSKVHNVSLRHQKRTEHARL